MGVRNHFLSNPWSKLVHYQYVPEIALEVCYHTRPCPTGILKGPEIASGISLPLDVHDRLFLLAS